MPSLFTQTCSDLGSRFFPSVSNISSYLGYSYQTVYTFSTLLSVFFHHHLFPLTTQSNRLLGLEAPSPTSSSPDIPVPVPVARSGPSCSDQKPRRILIPPRGHAAAVGRSSGPWVQDRCPPLPSSSFLAWPPRPPRPLCNPVGRGSLT